MGIWIVDYCGIQMVQNILLPEFSALQKVQLEDIMYTIWKYLAIQIADTKMFDNQIFLYLNVW